MTKEVKIESIDVYRSNAPAAAKFGPGVSDLAGIREATNARTNLSNRQSTAEVDRQADNEALNGDELMSDLFVFRAHRAPTIFGRGTSGEARQLCALFNRHRASNKYAFEPVTDAAGNEPIDIAAEIEANLAPSEINGALWR